MELIKRSKHKIKRQQIDNMIPIPSNLLPIKSYIPTRGDNEVEEVYPEQLTPTFQKVPEIDH
jgi:hypothetical protein